MKALRMENLVAQTPLDPNTNGPLVKRLKRMVLGTILRYWAAENGVF